MGLKKSSGNFSLWWASCIFPKSKSCTCLLLAPTGASNEECVSRQVRSTSRRRCKWWSRGWSAATATSATPTASTRWSSLPTRTCGACLPRRRRTRTSWRAPRSSWRVACRVCSYNVSTQLSHGHAHARHDNRSFPGETKRITEFSLLVCKTKVGGWLAESSVDRALRDESLVLLHDGQIHEAALKKQVKFDFLKV